MGSPIEYLTLSELVSLHAKAVERYGGARELRDAILLDSCLAQPQTQVFGHERFSSVVEKAAAYCLFIVKLHPFVDGNKRTGLLAAIHFMLRNGATPAFDQDLMYETILNVAKGEAELSELVAAFSNTVH